MNSRSRLRYLQLLAGAMRAEGIKGDRRGVRYLRASRVRAAGDGVLVQADGELIGELPMTFEIVAAPVELIAPPADKPKRIGYQHLR
ncbi:MAG TPA: hypothetical protein VM864_06245 [Pyrinomonadaceae bacterium]|nr:hypothetical protein [Pyrinomonadaceae bacterium]